jgi:hypothetical protein
MSTRVKIKFFIIVAVLVGTVVWQIAQLFEPEPVYKGKRLSVWLNTDTEGGGSGEVLRQIGTNAIPTLLKLLGAEDSALKIKLINLLQRQHFVKIDYTPAETWHYRAAFAFSALGTNAQTAVPALIKIVDDNKSPSSRLCAIESLGYVALPTKQAISALSCWATNADVKVQSWAKLGLERICPENAATADIANRP